MRKAKPFPEEPTGEHFEACLKHLWGQRGADRFYWLMMSLFRADRRGVWLVPSLPPRVLRNTLYRMRSGGWPIERETMESIGSWRFVRFVDLDSNNRQLRKQKNAIAPFTKDEIAIRIRPDWCEKMRNYIYGGRRGFPMTIYGPAYNFKTVRALLNAGGFSTAGSRVPRVNGKVVRRRPRRVHWGYK